MKKLYKYIAVSLVVLFVFLEVVRDVHYVLHHQPPSYLQIGWTNKEVENHHHCCSLELDRGGGAEPQVSKPKGSCPFEHVKFMPYRSPEGLIIQGRTVLLKRFLNLFEGCGVIRRVVLDHRLRAPPLGNSVFINFTDAYLK